MLTHQHMVLSLLFRIVVKCPLKPSRYPSVFVHLFFPPCLGVCFLYVLPTTACSGILYSRLYTARSDGLERVASIEDGNVAHQVVEHFVECFSTAVPPTVVH
ncbi:hypothetical protein IscW_ISCW017503 [Ixodes scapularis]|uniref:Uncharacterized protein n=1 Tax=Ixodes scapularis TaxID=6945 RepID=B7PBL7_IXOSC|nr:hypothetical protein IscW_ISCW017503 [Ixodes scapularis]|eukprot:XP_002408542.1 hypothetical protein IscW_ISCW017503 [Ixodes scapularis]